MVMGRSSLPSATLAAQSIFVIVMEFLIENETSGELLYPVRLAYFHLSSKL